MFFNYLKHQMDIKSRNIKMLYFAGMFGLKRSIQSKYTKIIIIIRHRD